MPEQDAAPAQAEQGEIADVPVKKLAQSSVPAPRSDQPRRGPATAPVVLQVWSDFECPFCARTVPLLAELEREFGSELAIVWRALPLPGHAHSRQAATAALQAYAERGPASFWRVHDRLFAEAADGLDDAEIERVLAAERVDVTRYRNALKSGSHDPAIATDLAAADAVAVEGTPAFLINDYYLYGVTSLDVMRAVVRKARDEARR